MDRLRGVLAMTSIISRSLGRWMRSALQGGAPIPPLNLVGDFAGGALYLTSGILAALHQMRTTGKGKVVDAAIIDGVVHLMTLQYMFQQMGAWIPDRGANLIDGGVLRDDQGLIRKFGAGWPTRLLEA